MKDKIESEDPCPKCGKKQWWLPSGNSNFLIGKDKVAVVSYCTKCHTWFKTEHKLVKLIGRSDKSAKIASKKNPHQLSNWQMFCADGLKQGKTLKELSYLYWHEWQTNSKFPNSLASITSSTTKGEGQK